RWLLSKVCHQAVAWQKAGFGELSVAMNCSAVQFRQGDLVNEVRRALHDSGLKPQLLELELTESILIENSDGVLETIRGLKALGVRMSIDDFGTGYSSMAYLKRFAVDKLKIDQSFVRGLLSNPQDAAIVQAVITLGHSFDMKVIAEGVETFDLLDALALRGCDEAQGYYYAKALSPGDFAVYMEGRTVSSFAVERWVFRLSSPPMIAVVDDDNAVRASIDSLVRSLGFLVYAHHEWRRVARAPDRKRDSDPDHLHHRVSRRVRAQACDDRQRNMLLEQTLSGANADRLSGVDFPLMASCETINSFKSLLSAT
nr:uncharacterized signaling protein CC_0091-like [Tanacetum cinerariifolium]